MEQEHHFSHIKYYIIKLAVYLVLALCVFIFRESLASEAVLRYFIGGLMIFYGLEETLYEIVYHGINFWKQEKVYLGFVEIVLGCVLLIAPLDLETTCVIWATWSIVREAFEIRELVTEIKSVLLTIVSGLESLAVIVLSIMLILEPGEHHALIHLYLLLVELFLTPFVPLMDELLEKYKKA